MFIDGKQKRISGTDLMSHSGFLSPRQGQQVGNCFRKTQRFWCFMVVSPWFFPPSVPNEWVN